MSTHNYARKSYFGGWADPWQGMPSLSESIKTLFPGYTFVIRMASANCAIVFEAELTPTEVTTLDGVYAAWDPESTPLPVELPHTMALAVNASTTSTEFVDLLSSTITLPEGTRTLYAEVSGDCTSKTATLEFQILVNGTPIRGGAIYASGSSGVTHYEEVAVKGSYVIKLQWRVTSGNARIRASTNLLEHAFIRIS